MRRLDEADRCIWPLENNWALSRCQDLGEGSQNWEGGSCQSSTTFHAWYVHFLRQITAQRSLWLKIKISIWWCKLGPRCRGVRKEPVAWGNAWKWLEAKKVWGREGDKMCVTKSCSCGGGQCCFISTGFSEPWSPITHGWGSWLCHLAQETCSPLSHCLVLRSHLVSMASHFSSAQPPDCKCRSLFCSLLLRRLCTQARLSLSPL